ncbi:uncharacterized protein GGS25DRAFT_453017 [Hypoxylon fragiforme]|uniref:uncharacterized protein n=1 Tax=Hypoxylon fragiforme TaxID=63214 RepID=UPI0020C73261|nr:uncharacterized protein GGS25DRAFT_453017 [Hypoxylon fragiforme]KAI2604243.1 hypothetical protein GGS25DRAFT_453017 [Hypoxylon fragiforme]
MRCISIVRDQADRLSAQRACGFLRPRAGLGRPIQPWGLYLLLVDLILSLVVCDTVPLVGGQRIRRKGLLRYPAFWHMLWNFCGGSKRGG